MKIENVERAEKKGHSYKWHRSLSGKVKCQLLKNNAPDPTHNEMEFDSIDEAEDWALSQMDKLGAV